MSTKQEEITFYPEEKLPDAFYPDNKFTIDISKHIPPNFDLSKIVFVVKNIPQHTVKVSIVDKEMAVNRPLGSNRLLFSGDKIELKMMERQRQALFLLDIR